MRGDGETLWNSFESAMTGLLNPHCYQEIFVKQHFFDMGCNKMLLSKVLGYAILIGSLLVKFPQIVKIKWNKSGVGVSVLAESIMLAAIFGSMAYGYTSEFPLSAYGDSFFLFIQTILVILLVLYYQRKYTVAAAYLGSTFSLSLSRLLHLVFVFSSVRSVHRSDVSQVNSKLHGRRIGGTFSCSEFNQSTVAVVLHLSSQIDGQSLGHHHAHAVLWLHCTNFHVDSRNR